LIIVPRGTLTVICAGWPPAPVSMTMVPSQPPGLNTQAVSARRQQAQYVGAGAPELRCGCGGRKFTIVIISEGTMRNYSIGEAAKVSGLSARTIRYYEQIGLIPEASRNAGNGAAAAGARVYSEDDVGRLRFVRRAREVELSLKDVRSLVSVADGSGCPSTHSSYREILRGHLRGLDARINHLLALRTSVHSMLGVGRGAPAACCAWGACECLGSTPSGRRPARTPAGLA
jgi:DNA-binding transcriptional MerR regulator